MGLLDGELFDVFEVYETNGKNVLIFLDKDKAENQQVINGDKPVQSKVRLNKLELQAIKDIGYIWA